MTHDEKEEARRALQNAEPLWSGKQAEGERRVPNPTRSDPTPPAPNDPAALIALFSERWPQTFFVDGERRRPLKINVHRNLFVALEDIDPDAIRDALRMYVGDTQYLRNLQAGAERIDLNGEADGIVTRDAANAAANRIRWREDKTPQPSLHPANAAKPRLTLSGRRA